MMKSSYLLILGDNNFDSSIFEEFLKNIISPTIELNHNKDYDIAIFDYHEELELKENINAFLYDMNAKIKCYISKAFDSIDVLFDNVNVILNYFNHSVQNSVYDEKDLLSEVCKKNLDDIKPFVFKDYLYDIEMQNIINALVDNDLNILKTSKAIYMHRNTLMNKLERFYEKTGYDIRKFKDLYIIYNLIK